jgi:hypothetical protein
MASLDKLVEILYNPPHKVSPKRVSTFLALKKIVSKECSNLFEDKVLELFRLVSRFAKSFEKIHRGTKNVKLVDDEQFLPLYQHLVQFFDNPVPRWLSRLYRANV